MTNNHKELCERLRQASIQCSDCGMYETSSDFDLAVSMIESQAANIQQQAERIAELEKERDALKADAEGRRELCNDLANIMHDQTVAMQSALIEWKFGKGAEEGLQWIVNTLDGPGLLPDTDAEHGNNAQFWFDTHRSHPFPKCFCGNPSHTLWMGQGFCCNEHYKEAKAKYDSEAEKETRS